MEQNTISKDRNLILMKTKSLFMMPTTLKHLVMKAAIAKDNYDYSIHFRLINNVIYKDNP